MNENVVVEALFDSINRLLNTIILQRSEKINDFILYFSYLSHYLVCIFLNFVYESSDGILYFFHHREFCALVHGCNSSSLVLILSLARHWLLFRLLLILLEPRLQAHNILITNLAFLLACPCCFLFDVCI